jgi:anti-anti-sigma factor
VTLKHAVSHMDGQVRVALFGEADLGAGQHLRALLSDVVAQRPSRITVDIRGLAFIDSQSISALIAARRAALQGGSRFRVANPRGQVLRVLTVAGVIDLLTGADPGERAGGGGMAPCA